MYSQLNDFALLTLLRNDDQKAVPAFEELYLRYSEKLLAIAAHRMENVDEAEEIVQDIFLNFWNRRVSLPENIHLNKYFATAVKFEVINRFAKQHRRMVYQTHLKAVGQSSDNLTWNQVRYEELYREIEKTVRLLPEKCEIVYRLSREEGFSEKQIAEKLNISAKTVQAHLTKALKAIRERMTGLLRH